MLKFIIIIIIFITSLFSQETTKKIKAGMPANFLPYFYLDKQKNPTGFAVEVFKELAKNKNIDYEIVVFPTYVDVEKAYRNKNIDLIIAGGISKARKEIGNFTVPIDTSIIKAYKLKTNPIKTINFIDDKKITLKTNNVSTKLFKNYPKNLIRVVNSKEEGIVTLLTKESDVFIFNENAVVPMLKQSGFDRVITSFGKEIKKVDFAIRVQKENIELVNILNDALIDLKKSSKFTELYNKYISNNSNKNYKEIFEKNIKQKNKLFLGNSDYEPLIFIKDNNLSGMIIELTKEIIKEGDIKANIDAINWAKAQDLMNTGKADALLQININEERKKIYDFSYPLLTSNFHLFKKNNRVDIYDLKSLNGKTIGVEKNGYPFAYLKKYPNINIKIIPSWKEGFKLLEDEKIDGIFVDKLIGDYTIIKNKLKDISSAEIPLDTTYSHIAVKKGNKELLDKINKGIKIISENGVKNAIIKKWSFKENSDLTVFTKEEKEYIKNNNFTICDQHDLYPLTGNMKNNLTGISGDVFEKINKILNLNYKIYDPISHKDLNEKVKQNKCDIVSYILENQKRFSNITPTNSYFENHYISIGNSKSGFLDNYENYKNSVFYVRFKVNKDEILKKYPNLNILIEQDVPKIIELIKNNPNSHFIGLKAVLEQLIQKYGYNKYKVTGIFDRVNIKANFGVNEKDKTLLNILNKAILSIPKEDLLNIPNKYSVKEFVVENENFEKLKYLLIIIVLITTFIIIGLITIRNKIKNEKEKFESLLELSTESIFILDLKGNFIKYSNEARNNLGYKLEEMKELNIFDIDKTLNTKEFKNILSTIKHKNKLTYTRTHTRKNGSQYIAQINAKIINLGNDNFIYCAIKDITEQLQFQEDLKREKDKANSEKQNALTALEEAKVSEEEAVAAQEEMILVQEELLQANQAKSEFLANMSHEIRTPLAGIISLTDIMLDEECTKLQRENLTIIKNSSHTLKNVINDILDFSKIQAGKFHIVPREFSLKEMLNDLESLFKPLTQQKGINLIFKIDDNVHDELIGDSLRIHQIFNNLIGNSVKFTHKGRIEVSVQALLNNKNNTKLKFTIKDTGIGISEKIKSQIFDSFTQGELSNTKIFQGTGLGLSISKSFVELMNGEIWFDSVENLGTTFYFTLELEKTKMNKNNKDNKNKITSTKDIFKDYRVLVVEDSEVNQLVAKKLLSKLGFEVHIANDGEEAVDALKNVQYDLIYMDIQMPNIDGYEATKLIRKFNKKIPIIALSAAVQDIDKKKSLEAGMNEHLKKPIELNELINITSKFLDIINNKKLQRKNEENNQKDEKMIFNHNYLVQEYGEDIAKELTTIFYTEYKDISSKVNDLDSVSLDKYIHKLKGSSGSLKINEIYELCVILREKIDDRELLNKLVEKTNDVTNIMEKYL